jgi:hypothetical protein
MQKAVIALVRTLQSQQDVDSSKHISSEQSATIAFANVQMRATPMQ